MTDRGKGKRKDGATVNGNKNLRRVRVRDVSSGHLTGLATKFRHTILDCPATMAAPPLPPLLYTPTKRKLHQTDPFFELGNIESRAAWLHKQVRHHNHSQAHKSAAAAALDNYALITEEVERLQRYSPPVHLPSSNVILDLLANFPLLVSLLP